MVINCKAHKIKIMDDHKIKKPNHQYKIINEPYTVKWRLLLKNLNSKNSD